MAQITWVRPSGTEITTSDTDENIRMAAQAGWKNKTSAEPKTKKTVKKAD